MGNDKSRQLSEEEVESLQSSTNFRGDEIKDWHIKFREDFPTGVINLKDFVGMYSKLFPGGDAKSFATHVFKSYDADGNGEIDFHEFMGTLSVSSRGSSAEKLNWAFNMYDSNNDGNVSLGEVTDMICAIYRLKGDFNKSNAEDSALRVFKFLDKNKDGEMTREEFIEGASNSKEIMDILQGQH